MCACTCAHTHIHTIIALLFLQKKKSNTTHLKLLPLMRLNYGTLKIAAENLWLVILLCYQWDHVLYHIGTKKMISKQIKILIHLLHKHWVPSLSKALSWGRAPGMMKTGALPSEHHSSQRSVKTRLSWKRTVSFSEHFLISHLFSRNHFSKCLQIPGRKLPFR